MSSGLKAVPRQENLQIGRFKSINTTPHWILTNKFVYYLRYSLAYNYNHYVVVRSQRLFFLKSGWIMFYILAQSHQITPSKNAALQVNPCLVKEKVLISTGSFLLSSMYDVWTDNSKFEHDNNQNIIRESIEIWNKIHGLAYAYRKTRALNFKIEWWIPSFQTFRSFHCQTMSNHNVIQQ